MAQRKDWLAHFECSSRAYAGALRLQQAGSIPLTGRRQCGDRRGCAGRSWRAG